MYLFMVLPRGLPREQNWTVLVVDDDDAGRSLAVQALRDGGYTVVEASHPAGALEIAGSRDQRLDLLVTDIIMPAMLGHELAERIGQVRPGIPVLRVSGAAERVLHDDRDSFGPSDFLLKPFSAAQMLAAVAALLEAAHHKPEPPATPARDRRHEPVRGGTEQVGPEPRKRWLPDGRTLPVAEWERRHHLIVLIIWAHVLALLVAGLLVLGAGLHAVAESAVVVPFALIAGYRNASRPVREIAATFGLLTSSAVIVHLSGGEIEAHFHYFASIVLLSLYESWVPFLIAIAYVLLQHGTMSAVGGLAVFNHGNPWGWSAIHAAAVALTAAASTLAWRLNEDVRQAEKRVRERLAHRALHDELTGLANRRKLIEELERASISCAAGRCAGLAVLFMDIDNFKLINDSFDHSIGDRLLIDMAARLDASTRESDLVARTGGDEFVVLARDIDSDEEAVMVARRIFDGLHEPFDFAGSPRQMSLSIGISRLTREDCSISDALGRADAAMYRAKADGRGRLQFADADVLEQARRRLEVETALDRASQDQFTLRYQPIVSLVDGSVAGVEALMRWHHPLLGDVAPAEFIPIAENNGRILELGRWTLELAARESVRWEGLIGRPVKVLVNVSANQLTHPSFPQAVVDALGAAQADGSHIALELTETSLIEGVIPATTLAALDDAGVDLVLDDFGTGFSSLGYLSRFPITMIKLDRSFITEDQEGPAGAVIVDAVAHLARGLGLPALAEGIETVEQLSRVRGRGYALAQGYLFARPQPAADIDVLLSRPRPFAALLGTPDATDLAA